MYIQATRRTLTSITPDQAIPTALLRTCRQLHLEAAEYLYSRYLFNIIGRKEDCLARYGPFLRTMSKHVNDEVHVDAFSNGPHSATMCISMHSGNGKIEILNRRDRGVRRTIEEMQLEMAERNSGRTHGATMLSKVYHEWYRCVLYAIVAAIIAVLVRCCIV